MADVGFGELATTTGYARSYEVKDAVRDAHPLYEAMDDHGGIDDSIVGGEEIIEEAKTAGNSTVKWVGENGTVSLAGQKHFDAARFPWKFQLCSVVWTLADQYKNAGDRKTQFIDLIAKRYDVAEDSMMNEFHEGMLSNGTGTGGLQLTGLAALVSTTPTTGTVGNIDRSDSNAAWYRNSKFDTGSDWSDGAVSASNVKRFLDKGFNSTIKNSKIQQQLGFMGQTHFEFLTSAVNAQQVINDNSGTARAGFDKIYYRGVPFYLGSGINYSGASSMTATRTYLLNVKDGGVNLRFHKKAKFDMLDPVASADQAAVSRLFFTMCAMTIGGLAKHCWVGFD